MSNSSLKIDNARYLVTVDAERRIIRDGAVVIANGLITHVGKAEELAAVSADQVIDASEMVITPGFLNGHMHISYAHPVRGIFSDDVEHRLRLVFAMQSVMTEEEEYLTTLLGLTELLGSGTTTFVDPGTTRFPEACMAAYEAAGCRVVIGEQVTDQDNLLNLPVYDAAEAVRRIEASVEALDGRLSGRMRAWTMPFSVDLCSAELLIAAKQIADDHATAMTLHHSGGVGRQRPTPTERLAELGVMGSNVVLSHGMGLTDTDIALIADSGTAVVICPSTVLKTAANTSEGGRLPEFLSAGISVSLGTDSVNSSNFLDMVRSMSLAATIYKDVRGDPTLVPPETALELATRSGATALQFGDMLGSIEVGRRGDLVLFDTLRPEWRSLTDPVRNLVYSANGSSVDTVIVDGRVVVESGRATFVDDMEALIHQVEKAGRRIRAETGIDFPSRWPVV